MPVVYRYLIREVFLYAGIILVSVVGIYLVVDFFERIDNFLEAGVPVTRTFVYLAYKIPMIVAQVMPVALLLSVLVAFGLMGKHNEIIALKSGGISFSRLLKPLAGVGLAFSILLFLTAEIFVPVTAAKVNAIWWGEVKQRAAVVSREKNIWLKDGSRIVHIKYYDRDARTAFGVTRYEFDPGFRLVHRIDAEKALYRPGGAWRLFGLMQQALDRETGEYHVTHAAGPLALDLGITPQSLETVVKKSEEMGLMELLAYARRIESEGYDATRYRVDLHAKIAFPFVCFILSFVSAGIAGRKGIRDALPVAVACGIAVAFLYWIFYSFCISIGYGGMLPPFVAAWTANFLFSCLAVITLLHVE
jgi:lipopolysaccharide export system permease protein